MSIVSIVAAGRRLVDATLEDRCRISDRSLVPDGTGGKRETYAERAQTIACRFVMPRDDDPVLSLDSVFGRAEMVLELPRGTVYREGARIRNMFNNKSYQIVRDVTVPSELQVIVRVGIKAV
jgi:hypothetical protein